MRRLDIPGIRSVGIMACLVASVICWAPVSPLVAQSTAEASDDRPTTRTTTTAEDSTAPVESSDAASASATETEQDDPGFILVIHASNEIDELERSRISKMFLKKIKRWPDKDKTPVEPVDQTESAPIRELFTRAVHNKDLFAIKTYWQRMIFSGRMAPPAELQSDEEVLQFVRSRPGAVGYVPSGTDLGQGVKELKISRDEK